MSNTNVSPMSSLAQHDAATLIGQTVTRVDASEYGLTLTFANGAVLEVSGQTYGDCALSVELTQKAQR